MNRQTHPNGNDMAHLAEDARALMAATADVAGEKVEEARQRLTDALDRGKEIFGRMRKKAVEGARSADDTVRDNPYTAIGLALGVGAFLGFLLARRKGKGG